MGEGITLPTGQSQCEARFEYTSLETLNEITERETESLAW